MAIINDDKITMNQGYTLALTGGDYSKQCSSNTDFDNRSVSVRNAIPYSPKEDTLQENRSVMSLSCDILNLGSLSYTVAFPCGKDVVMSCSDCVDFSTRSIPAQVGLPIKTEAELVKEFEYMLQQSTPLVKEKVEHLKNSLFMTK